MHRHGYKGRKFGRENDQRRALLKGLASNLIENESIVTTSPKAKELVPYVEKLITKAKIGNLHNRRQVISKLANVKTAHKLVDELAPKLSGPSGHLTVKRDSYRRGDNSPMARVSFIGLDKATTSETKTSEKITKTSTTKKVEIAKKPKNVVTGSRKPSAMQKSNRVVAKRTGVRGNK